MGRNIKDLTGMRFGKLTALEIDEELTAVRSGTYWKCRCDCGNVVSRNASNLKRPIYPAHSCGCDSHKVIVGPTIHIYKRNRSGVIHHTVALCDKHGTTYIFGTVRSDKAKKVQEIAEGEIRNGTFSVWYNDISKYVGDERWKRINARIAGGITA